MESERSSDAVCGTDDVSRRLRRTEPYDSQRRGARMLQHAERVVSAVDSDGCCSVDFVHGHPWLSTPTIPGARHENHGCPWTKSKERMTPAVDSDEPNRATPNAGVPACFSMRNGWCQPSTPTNRTVRLQTRGCPHASACGTDGVSRRLRRLAFRGLRPRAHLVVDSDDSRRATRKSRGPLDEVQGTNDASRRLRRTEPCDSQRRGARMLQHAERMMSAVDSDERFRRLVSAGTHGLSGRPLSSSTTSASCRHP
jgi:hypothetical protein